MKYETLGADLLETVCGVYTEFRAGISRKDLAYYINVSGLFSLSYHALFCRRRSSVQFSRTSFVRFVITWRESRRS